MQGSHGGCNLTHTASETEATPSGPSTTFQRRSYEIINSAKTRLFGLTSGFSSVDARLRQLSGASTRSTLPISLGQSGPSEGAPRSSFREWFERFMNIENLADPAQSPYMTDSGLELQGRNPTGNVPPDSPEQVIPISDSTNRASTLASPTPAQEDIQTTSSSPRCRVAEDQSPASRPVDHPTSPQNISPISANLARASEEEAAHLTDGDCPRPNDISCATRSARRDRIVQGQNMLPCLQSSNCATSNSRHVLSIENFCSCHQAQGHPSTTAPPSQASSASALLAEQESSRDTGYPPDFMGAFVDAMHRNSSRLDDLERGVTGLESDGPWVSTRGSQMSLIVTAVGMGMMLLAGGTKLYEAIRPPSPQ